MCFWSDCPNGFIYENELGCDEGTFPVLKSYFFKWPTGTSCKKCSSLASDWELNQWPCKLSYKRPLPGAITFVTRSVQKHQANTFPFRPGCWLMSRCISYIMLHFTVFYCITLHCVRLMILLDVKLVRTEWWWVGKKWNNHNLDTCFRVRCMKLWGGDVPPLNVSFLPVCRCKISVGKFRTAT